MRWILLLVLLSMISVKADTSYPIPNNIAMERGDEAEFQFQVQNLRGGNNIVCSYAVEDSQGLELSFPEETRILAGQRTNVKATVSVPRSLDDGGYTAKFCVHCKPDIEDFGGSTVRQSDCGLPINVVVGRVEDGRIRIADYIWYVIGIILVLTIVILYIFIRKRNK